jgi:molybdopterin synthase catalytic subunit
VCTVLQPMFAVIVIPVEAIHVADGFEAARLAFRGVSRSVSVWNCRLWNEKKNRVWRAG